jgi:Protein of unknown function (DUF1592)/Protein of unknown function (DUF1588)/Protein of unknown function (DUF1595)/Protein of unknown function (DUF1585)
MRVFLSCAAFVAASGLLGCNGTVGGHGSGPGGAGTITGTGGASSGTGGTMPAPTSPDMFGTCPSGGGEPGASPLIKLSTIQYRNTVRDLLTASGLPDVATEVAPMLAAIPDDSTVAFRGLDTRISSDHIQGYFNVATAVADAATKTSQRLTTLAGSCAGTSPLAASCLDAFLASFGKRAFRRPLAADELAEMKDVATGTSPAPANATEAIRNVVVMLLMSPRFVNHLELAGTPISGQSDLLALDPYEVASRLSYTFWQTLPDDALLAAAAATGDGSLATDAGFATQLDRVFADPRTRDTIWQFWDEWMRFDSFTGFSSDRPAFMTFAAGENVGVPGHDHWGDMVTEIHDLTDLYTWTQSGTLDDLLTSDLSVTKSADLAHLYGVPAWSGSGDYPRFTDGSRTGILQRAALLADNLETTNPFHRGAFVRRSILCDNLPRPDPNSLPAGSLDPPPQSTAMTTRQRYEAKVAGNGLCAGCHDSFSNIGYVMEAYDALGRFRTIEKVYDEQTGALLATLPLDTSGIPQVIIGDMRPVAGPADLNQRIVDSGKVEACLSANYFRYALRRDPTADSADACAYDSMRSGLASGGALAAAFRGIATSAGFRQHKVGTP